MKMKMDSTNGMSAGRGKMLFALGILAVLAMAVSAFAVAEHPVVGWDVEATDGETGGGVWDLRKYILS